MKQILFRLLPCFLCLLILVGYPFIQPQAATYVTSGKVTKDWTSGQMTSGGYLTMDGQNVFCVEPHIIFKSNQTYEVTTSRPSYISATKARKLGLIAYYGTKYFQTERHYAAAQSLIWIELGESESSSTFKVAGVSVKPEMDQIMTMVNTHDLKPSFTSQTYTLNVGDTIEITDTNQVLERFTVEPINGLDIQKNGNTLSIKALENAPTSATLEVNHYGDSQNGTTIYYKVPGTSEGNGWQICGRFYIEDPIYSSFTLTINHYEEPILKNVQTSKEGDDEGTISFKKIDALTKQPLENVEASISMDGQMIVSNQKTNKNGLIETTFKKHYQASSDVITYITNYNKLNPQHQSQYKDYPKSYDEALNLASKQASDRLAKQISEASYTFTATETKTKDGYYFDDTKASSSITTKDNHVMFAFENEYQTLNINLLKLNQDSNQPIEDVVFGLYAASDIYHPDGKTGLLYTKDELVATFEKTNASGETSLSHLYLGNYYLKEIDHPSSYISNNDIIPIELSLTSDKTISISKTLYNSSSKVEIYKIDASTNTPLSGAALELYDSKNNLVDSWVSEEASHECIGLNVHETYTLKETKAPLGFSVSKPITFMVEDTLEVQEVIMENHIIEGLVTFNKTGDVFKAFKDGKSIYNNEPIDGSELTIYASKDIILGNGVCLYKKDDVVATLESNSSITLPYGFYYAYETKVPEGYLQDDKFYTFEINGKKDIVLNLNNELPTFKLDFTKTLEGTHDFKDITFGIYTNKDELITICKLNENGHLVDVPNLPYGSYYLKEETTHPLYLLDETKYPFSITYQDKDTKDLMIPINDGNAIMNTLKRASITLHKTDEENKPLKGASFVLLNADQEILETQITNQEGMIIFENLIYDTYYIQEKVAPEGYQLNEEILKIELDEDKKIHVSNKLIPVEVIEEDPEEPVVQKTGDHNAILPLVVTFSISSCLLLISIKKKKA